MADDPTVASFSCPLPLRDYPYIVLGHGGGGQLSAELVEHLFLPSFRNVALELLGDAAVLPPQPDRLAFSTDSFVVRPLFFPGGCIGDLAVNGTVNDLAMMGAAPLFLSVGFILEEGFSVALLSGIVQRMAAAAERAGVRIVTGDTKVVDKGHGDGCYINTAGIGTVRDGVHLGPASARPGDAVLLSGTIADHGMAIMSVREGLEFESVIQSDSAPLHQVVADMLDVTLDLRALRDPTRGGVSASLNEIARASDVGIVIREASVPMNRETQSACELLGLDPLCVANEGKLLAVVPDNVAEDVVQAMRAHPPARQATVIGYVTADHPGTVIAETSIGGKRVVSRQVGEQLPRIC